MHLPDANEQAPVALLPLTVRIWVWSLGALIGLALDVMLSSVF